MEGFWYYANGDKPVGPLTFAELRSALTRLSQPHSVLVWHASFDNWRQAQNIPEIRSIARNLPYPEPAKGELVIEPRPEYGSKSVEQKDQSHPATWRKVGGTLMTIVVFVTASTIVRTLTRSVPNPAKPDIASPISGKLREDFIMAGRETCMKKQESESVNKSLRLSREALMGYCSCYMDALADSMTYGDLDKAPRDGKISPEMQKKIDKASPPCWESLQRRLMGTSEK
jgi:hypothetical protein